MLISIVILAFNSVHSLASPLAPQNFTAKYRATLAGFDITATSQLTTLENGHRELRFTASSWFAKIEEFSVLDWVQKGQLVPQRYEYHRTGLGRDRHAVLTFDWLKNSVVNNVQKKPWKMDVPNGALDKLSVQLQLRQDLINERPLRHYQIADGGRLKTYAFTVLQEEVIDTPLGKLNTVKIRRRQITDKEKKIKRETTLWLAKDWDYLLVRLHRKEKNGKHYNIELDSATLADIPLKGLDEKPAS